MDLEFKVFTESEVKDENGELVHGGPAVGVTDRESGVAVIVPVSFDLAVERPEWWADEARRLAEQEIVRRIGGKPTG